VGGDTGICAKQASLRPPMQIVTEDSGQARGVRVPESPLGC